MYRPQPHSAASSVYSRSNSDPYQSPPPGHHPLQPYSLPSPVDYNNPMSPIHPPVDRDLYHRPSHSGDQRPYAPHQSFSLPPHPPSAYRHRPPPPHPPAPPAPPRPPSYRKSHPHLQTGTSSPRAGLDPALTYYRPQAEYDSQHSPTHSISALEHSCVSHLRVGTEQGAEGVRPRSASTAGDYGSAMPEHVEGTTESTPSPIDPTRIQQWEEENAHATLQHPSPSNQSEHEDENEKDTVSQRQDGVPHEAYSSASFAHSGDRCDYTDMGNAGLKVLYTQKRSNSDYYPSPHHQAQFQTLAHQPDPLNSQRGSIGLNSLVDGEPGDRPAYPIPTIIKCAILGSPRQRLTLSELYLAMEMRFEYYRGSDKKSWRNSVRHNLSLNNQFAKNERPITEPGKGNYWVVVPNMPQGNKRERKRNKKPGKRALAAEAERLAREKGPAGYSGKPSLDPQLSTTTAGYPVAMREYSARTLPANAGSYAAVTGALPEPPQLDRQLFRPWDGDGDGSPSNLEMALQDPSEQPPSTVPTDQGSQSTNGDPENQSPQPQFGESSLRPVGLAPPAYRLEVAGSNVHQTSTENSRPSNGPGPARSPTTRSRYRYDPIPTAPQNAFAELATQVARDGTGATGNGGPALAGRRKRKRSRAIDQWDSEGNDSSDDDDEYLPRKRRNTRGSLARA